MRPHFLGRNFIEFVDQETAVERRTESTWQYRVMALVPGQTSRTVTDVTGVAVVHSSQPLHGHWRRTT